jgi:hypothetical protein
LASLEVGVLEVGAHEVGAHEVGVLEVGVLEVGAHEVGAHEVGVHEVGVLEVGVLEVGAHEVDLFQAHPLADGSLERLASAGYVLGAVHECLGVAIQKLDIHPGISRRALSARVAAQPGVTRPVAHSRRGFFDLCVVHAV